ncbi:MAG: YciI family protein [Pseudomonadota bacterium]
MKIALIARDKPGHLDTRKANRDAHLAYADGTGCVVTAGPLLDENEDMCGSLIVLDLPDLDAARAWAAKDPYAKAGLFQSVELIQWKKVR